MKQLISFLVKNHLGCECCKQSSCSKLHNEERVIYRSHVLLLGIWNLGEFNGLGLWRREKFIEILVVNSVGEGQLPRIETAVEDIKIDSKEAGCQIGRWMKNANGPG